MKILAIDTTEQACSAALLVDGQAAEDFQIGARQHSQLILPMIEGLLGDAGLALSALDSLAFARGPGSFTGVRIAAAVIQGLAVAADLPVVPISSLLALAQGVCREHGEPRVLAAFDARMQELYWAPCKARDGLMQFAGEERVGAAHSLSLPAGEGAWAIAGSALGGYAETFERQLGKRLGARYPDAMVHAQDVALLAQRDFANGLAVAAERAVPVYLRDQVAHKMPGAGRA
jgi:tRNA threonylcarbamoyladenosine biosynthesis protein TsaB